MTREVLETIKARRSHKVFTPRPVSEEEIRVLLDAAVRAPNHKMTQPWGFVVLGPESKRAYAETRARRKFKGDETQADKALKLIEETMAFPAIIAVTQLLDDDPVRREEDYAATWMGVQNLLLAATALGLSGKVNTGAILDDPVLRNALHMPDRERMVTIIHIGEPAEELPPRDRIPAEEKTRWLP